MIQVSEIKLNSFRNWLTVRGAEIMESGPVDIVRFRTTRGTSAISVSWSFTGEALAAWTAFKTSTPWDAGVRRVKNKMKSAVVRKIIEELEKRDGSECFFCGLEIDISAKTLEHLLPLSMGGNNHRSNLAVAHRQCNELASNLSIAEKVKLRDKLRKEYQ